MKDRQVSQGTTAASLESIGDYLLEPVSTAWGQFSATLQRASEAVSRLNRDPHESWRSEAITEYRALRSILDTVPRPPAGADAVYARIIRAMAGMAEIGEELANALEADDPARFAHADARMTSEALPLLTAAGRSLEQLEARIDSIMLRQRQGKHTASEPQQ